MNGKPKTTPPAPSDAQAREKLALYVYEYLLHVGAQKAAQSFLTEIRWEKNISLGEAPGFLYTWWCVFWDLYCAAPERRDQCEHSNEAKAFHEYSSFVNGAPGSAPSPLGQMPPNEGSPMPPNFFPNAGMRPSPPNHPNSRQSPHPHPPPSQMMAGPPYMGGHRYPPGPRPTGMRMPQGMGNEYSGPAGQPMMPNSMDPARHSGPPNMGPMNPRMNIPRPGPGMGPMGPGPFGPGMRGPMPNNNLQGGPGMPPMGMPGGRPQWHPNTSTPMNYPAPSPGHYTGPPGPPTPIMPSQQDPSNPDNMFALSNFRKSGGPGGGPMGPNTMGPGLNGDGLDTMKNSPANGGPGTPREDSRSDMGDFNLGGFGGPSGENSQMESAAIMKIKESMQEEAKRFEKDTDHPDFF